jgi:hypothetical protein
VDREREEYLLFLRHFLMTDDERGLILVQKELNGLKLKFQICSEILLVSVSL